MAILSNPQKFNEASIAQHYEKMRKWLMKRNKELGPAMQMREADKLIKKIKAVVEKNKGKFVDDRLRYTLQREFDDIKENWLLNLHRIAPDTKNRLYCFDFEFEKDTIIILYNEALRNLIAGVDTVSMVNLTPTKTEFDKWAAGFTIKQLKEM